MAEVSASLKRIFILLNVFFMLMGSIIITLTLILQILTSHHGDSNVEGNNSSLFILYTIGAVTIMIAMVGACRAHEESKTVMTMFLVCLIIGCLLMLQIGVPTAVIRPELQDILEEHFRRLLPLATDELRDMVNTVQEQLHCSGLFSSRVWKGNFSESCLCSDFEEDEGLCRIFDSLPPLQKASVYKQPCLPFIIHYILLTADVVIVISFTLASLAVLGIILSSLIIYQMHQSSRPMVLLYAAAIFTSQPPKYQELRILPGTKAVPPFS